MHYDEDYYDKAIVEIDYKGFELLLMYALSRHCDQQLWRILEVLCSTKDAYSTLQIAKQKRKQKIRKGF